MVRNNTLVSATFAPQTGRTYGVYDMIERPDEQATTTFSAFEGSWRASDALTLTSKAGTSTGHGKTTTQNGRLCKTPRSSRRATGRSLDNVRCAATTTRGMW